MTAVGCLFVHGPELARDYTPIVENGVGIAVETVGLGKVYGEGKNRVRALREVSLEFPDGEFAAIMGPSGSGKSTLLHILGALDKPTSGRVVVGGTELSGLSDKELTLLRPEGLSGGEQQRVAIARALITFPDIILADEPTGNLDSKTGAEVLELLRESAARFEQTILLVTHDPRAAATAGRAIFLSDGRVVDEAIDPDQDEILERIRTLESDG